MVYFYGIKSLSGAGRIKKHVFLAEKNLVQFLVKMGIDSISVNADVASEIADYVAELEAGSNNGDREEGEKEDGQKEDESRTK